MFGKNPRISPLEARKRLLIAESELNRAELIQELQTTVDDFRSLAGHVKSIGLIVSSTALLVGTLTAFRRRKPGGTGARLFPLQAILKGAGLIRKLWTAFRQRGRDREGINSQDAQVG
jgi:hypothetical protein